MKISTLRNNLRDYGLLISLIVIIGFFQIVTNGILLQPLNLTNLILQNSYIVVMALGMLLVIVAGHIDLSVGAASGFIGGLAAILMVHYEWSVTLTIIVALLVGMLIGAIQGWFVAYARIPSFIVTLAGMLVFKGSALALLQGQSIGPFPLAFQSISTGFLPDPFGGKDIRVFSLIIGVVLAGIFVGIDWHQRFKAQMHGLNKEPTALFAVRNFLFAAIIIYLAWQLSTYKGLPTVLILMGVLILFYQFIAGRTVIGRRIYALGGNEKAARLSGIDTSRLIFLTFANMGLLAAVAGIIFAARLNTATPKAGNGFELDVIAACFIGGASASGGVGRVIGAVIGAFIMGVMNNGMSILGIGIDYQQVIKGLVLLAAVFFDVYNRNRSQFG
ncbi:multiple monosaccharide ABC transporter permease [Meiothermus granaticius]|uniref:Xylose transport system permease protein XylH n=1 Tax=Meiothermus granaticius NBRC 107808 TaxID=1227551 RepID=A0A399F271_9DEIN|nr:multiple monosaccharide ABC transporter permease [Meiothermus granaticius]RIH90837.1 Xylose transport system permease protein XylH [Meiothermus granaticius NBRC 107808]GEM88539.1 sugar ABC transporter permease [Meiothermus granaticius NBRC 107808]